MKLAILMICLLFAQLSAAYTCEERIVFMYLFKMQSIISQKIVGPNSLGEGISFCKSELSPMKDQASKMIKECGTQKPDASNPNQLDDRMIEEFYANFGDGPLVQEEKQFTFNLVDKYKGRSELDLDKICQAYGKGSPLIKAKLKSK